MLIEIDFSSDEAIYQQLCNQIILGIATEQYTDGEVLPSVRQLAEEIGINMHTVNKAYTVLKQEGFVKVDRRRGAVISVDNDKRRAMDAVRGKMQDVIAEAICRGISREEMHELLDEMFDEYESYIGEAQKRSTSAGTSAAEETKESSSPGSATTKTASGARTRSRTTGTGSGKTGQGYKRPGKIDEEEVNGPKKEQPEDAEDQKDDRSLDDSWEKGQSGS